MASLSHAQSLDGWGSDGGPGSPVYGNSNTTGVTVGNWSLQTTNPASGAFWGPSTPNVMTTPGFYDALRNAKFIQYDLTLINQQLNGGSQFSGFAQDNEMAVQLFSNAGGSFPAQYNKFVQVGFLAANGTDTSGQNATWSGVDGTRTLKWDLTTFTAQDTDGSTKTIGQILTAHPDMQDAKIDFTQQLGGGTNPGNFFWDNVQLLDAGNNVLMTIGNFEGVPEPGTMALAALAVPPMIVAIRRRRAASRKVEAAPAAN
jgi:hypothetical protein